MSYSEVMTVLEAVQTCTSTQSGGMPLERFRWVEGAPGEDVGCFQWFERMVRFKGCFMFGMAYGSLVRIFVFCLGSITKSKFQDETEAMSTASAHLVFVENYLRVISVSPANVCYP